MEITEDQREDFRRWLEAFDELTEEIRSEEAPTWIRAAINILNKRNNIHHDLQGHIGGNN